MFNSPSSVSRPKCVFAYINSATKSRGTPAEIGKSALGKRRETNNLVEPLQQPADGREVFWLPLSAQFSATVRSALN